MDGDIRCCEKCDYDLTGLPECGRCPECGHFFSLLSGQGVRRVDLAQKRTDRLLARMRTIGLALAAAVVFALSLLLAWAKQKVVGTTTTIGSSGFLWSGVFISVILIVAAVTSYVYEEPPAE